MDASAAGVTVKSIDPTTPPLLTADTFATPADTPVAKPVEDTLTCEVLEETQVTEFVKLLVVPSE